MRKFILAPLFLMILLAACSTGNKFASSFGKRKYTKGYFADGSASLPAPTAALHRSTQRKIATSIATQPISTSASSPVTLGITKLSKASYKRNDIAKLSSANTATEPTTSVKAKEITNTDGTKNIQAEKSSSDNNYVGIVGCLVAIVGIILAFLSAGATGSVSLLAIIVMAVGDAVSIYSFFLDKLYLNWVAAIGICLTLLLVALLLL